VIIVTRQAIAKESSTVDTSEKSGPVKRIRGIHEQISLRICLYLSSNTTVKNTLKRLLLVALFDDPPEMIYINGEGN